MSKFKIPTSKKYTNSDISKFFQKYIPRKEGYVNIQSGDNYHLISLEGTHRVIDVKIDKFIDGNPLSTYNIGYKTYYKYLPEIHSGFKDAIFCDEESVVIAYLKDNQRCFLWDFEDLPLWSNIEAFTRQVKNSGRTIAKITIHKDEYSGYIKYLVHSFSKHNFPLIKSSHINLDNINIILQFEDSASCVNCLPFGGMPSREFGDVIVELL